MKKILLYILVLTFIAAALPACKPAPASYFSVLAEVAYSGGTASGFVMITDTRDFSPIKDVHVEINGRYIPFNEAAGNYSSSALVGIIPGGPVNLTMTKTDVNISNTGTMPDTTGSVTISLDGCFPLSTMMLVVN